MPQKIKSALSQEKGTASDALPDLGCACADIRRVARLVTQLYADEMGATIEPSQFALLSALKENPGTTQTPLGRALGFDKTTLSRNLRLMERNGWIVATSKKDLRERGFLLTPNGGELLALTKPGWKRAQARLRAAMTTLEWKTMAEVFGRVARAAMEARKKS